GHDTVHHAVHGPTVLGLKAGGVHKYHLIVVTRQHAVDAVARGLRLARHDRNLAADQGIGQRGLADVRSSDNSHEAAAKRGLCHSVSCDTATGSVNCEGRRWRLARVVLAGNSASKIAM